MVINENTVAFEREVMYLVTAPILVVIHTTDETYVTGGWGLLFSHSKESYSLFQRWDRLHFPLISYLPP